MKKILITICVAVGVYFAFSNTIDEFLYPEKRPGLNTYDTYTTTTQQTTTAVTQQTPIVTDEDGYEPRDDRKPDYVQPADPTWSKRTFNWTSYDKRYTFEISMNIQDDMYEYYHSLLRYSYVKDYHNYVSDDNNHKLVKQLADEIKSLCDQCDILIFQNILWKRFMTSAEIVRTRPYFWELCLKSLAMAAFLLSFLNTLQ